METSIAEKPGRFIVPVAEAYERWAATYDEVPNPLLAREERYLLPLLSQLPASNVLDLGCGTGRWLAKLVSRVKTSAVGIDCSAAMLQCAASKTLLEGRLAAAECENLPFPAAIFDLVICSFVLGHLRELEIVLRELARVTKPGADILVSDLHPDAYARGWRAGFRDGDCRMEVEMVPRSAETLVQAFFSCGFEPVTHLPLCLGSPEEPMFVRAGKGREFKQACRVPAILVCHFKRLSSPTPLSKLKVQGDFADF